MRAGAFCNGHLRECMFCAWLLRFGFVLIEPHSCCARSQTVSEHHEIRCFSHIEGRFQEQPSVIATMLHVTHSKKTVLVYVDRRRHNVSIDRDHIS